MTAKYFSLITLLLLSGCLPTGMGMHGGRGHGMVRRTTPPPEPVSQSLVTTAVNRLLEESFTIQTLAVWRFQSQSPALDEEDLRRQLITELVNSGRFTVLSRERLEEVISEQQLNQTGAMDEQQAVDMGKLIGAEGFLDGFITQREGQIILNLSLIETQTGTIVWSTTVQSPQP